MRGRAAVGAVLWVIVCAFGASGCATRAKIIRQDGAYLRGRIVSSTSQTIRVDVQGGPVDVPRSEIREIHYPGGAYRVSGAIFTVFGLSITATSLGFLVQSRGGYSGDVGFGNGIFIGTLVIGIAVLAGPGLGFLSHGVIAGRRSKERAGELATLTLQPAFRLPPTHPPALAWCSDSE